MGYWKHKDFDYVALGHNNLNADNAYFWRNEDGSLECGVFDWGGFGLSNLGRKVWWCFNCADWDHTSAYFDEYIQHFIDEYRGSGGPSVDFKVFRNMMLVAGLENI